MATLQCSAFKPKQPGIKNTAEQYHKTFMNAHRLVKQYLNTLFYFMMDFEILLSHDGLLSPCYLSPIVQYHRFPLFQ